MGGYGRPIFSERCFLSGSVSGRVRLDRAYSRLVLCFTIPAFRAMFLSEIDELQNGGFRF